MKCPSWLYVRKTLNSFALRLSLIVRNTSTRERIVIFAGKDAFPVISMRKWWKLCCIYLSKNLPKRTKNNKIQLWTKAFNGRTTTLIKINFLPHYEQNLLIVVHLQIGASLQRFGTSLSYFCIRAIKIQEFKKVMKLPIFSFLAIVRPNLANDWL